MTAEPRPRRRDDVPPDAEAMRDFDDVARMTERFVHWARWALVAGLPVWLVLLLLIPQTGLGAIGSLSLATLLTTLFVIAAERLGARRRGARSAGGGAPARAVRGGARRPMSAPKAVLLTLGGVVVLAYVIFIVATIARGG